jgi:hypothetical protein
VLRVVLLFFSFLAFSYFSTAFYAKRGFVKQGCGEAAPCYVCIAARLIITKYDSLSSELRFSVHVLVALSTPIHKIVKKPE